MLTSVSIRDFQSIQDASLRLGGFTVITGPTGSGKSAAIRALRLLAFNARGVSYIRHGQPSCRVLAADEECAVTIVRGGRGNDYYALDAAGQQQKYTKLGGAVPEDVSKVLALSELNFAGQFDRPYLMDESGGKIARTLGELTNVTVVFSAAAEGARRKNSLNADLRASRAQEQSLREAAVQYASLPAQREAMEQAEQAMAAAESLSARVERLGSLMDVLDRSQQLARQVKAKADRMVPPDISRLEDVSAKLSRASQLYEVLTTSLAEVQRFSEMRAAAQGEEAAASQALHDVLVAAGQCPTCGSVITDSTGHE